MIKDLSGRNIRGVFFGCNIIGVTRKSLNRVGEINSIKMKNKFENLNNLSNTDILQEHSCLKQKGFSLDQFSLPKYISDTPISGYWYCKASGCGCGGFIASGDDDNICTCGHSYSIHRSA
jgi:hypothetical protein